MVCADRKLQPRSSEEQNTLNLENENSVFIYSNLYEFLSSAEHKGRYLKECR